MSPLFDPRSLLRWPVVRGRSAQAGPEQVDLEHADAERAESGRAETTRDERADDPSGTPARALLTGLGVLGGGSVDALALGVPWRRSKDRWADDDLFELGVDRGGLVAAADGVPLAVREAGPREAPLTVVFCHGYCLSMETWHFQRRALAERFGDRVRMVFFDQRGHGQSGGTPRSDATIAQLARDLSSVLESTVPTGPVVLVGHSMGGMTVMSFAGQRPAYIRDRVVGVGLVSTAAGKLTDAGLGAVLESRALASVAGLAGRAPGVFTGGRRAMAAVLRPFIIGGSFGDVRTVSPSVARLVDTLIGATPVETLAHFFDTLTCHDETAALPALSRTRTTIICGDRDLLTPIDRSEELAEALPDAGFVRVPRAGHMVMLEAPETVDAALVALVSDALRTAGVEVSAE